jgi:hypothetical protein
LSDLFAAEARVDKEAGFAGFEVGAIAAGAAAEDGELDGHAVEGRKGERSGQWEFGDGIR